MEAKMPHEPCIQSEYLGEVFDPKKLKAFLKLAIPLVKKYDFQSFAFRGISGALIAPLLAHKTEKTLIVVRKPKPDESSHSSFPVEGDLNTQRYVIVDDFQSSGTTVNAIISGILKFNPSARCLGTLFYRDYFLYDSGLRIAPCRPTERLQNFVHPDPDQFLISVRAISKLD
jgi:orotate phosphoribosyltransferase